MPSRKSNASTVRIACARVAAALAEAGYDLRLVVGDGGHSPNHGGVLLPDALRWALPAALGS